MEGKKGYWSNVSDSEKSQFNRDFSEEFIIEKDFLEGIITSLSARVGSLQILYERKCEELIELKQQNFENEQKKALKMMDDAKKMIEMDEILDLYQKEFDLVIKLNENVKEKDTIIQYNQELIKKLKKDIERLEDEKFSWEKNHCLSPQHTQIEKKMKEKEKFNKALQFDLIKCKIQFHKMKHENKKTINTLEKKLDKEEIKYDEICRQLSILINTRQEK